MENFTIAKLHSQLKEKKVSALEIAKAYLERIGQRDREISAFITLSKELALSRAKEADEKIAKGQISLLTGIPFAVKDVILVKGIKNTCASKILENYIAPYSASCIEKINLESGVMLGKTNLDEFAMGASTEKSGFFPTKNPSDTTRVPGGSSGGSASAVADNMCVYALGSDTGGSIRQPASFCGVVGLKPTYGAVSRYGLAALTSSLDQVGPFGKTVEDVEIVFNVIKGKDVKDQTSVGKEVQEKEKLVVGMPKEYFVGGLEIGVEKAIDRAIEKIKSLGIEIKEISLPHTKYAIPVYYILNTSEASANLARYDGIRYGLSLQGKETDNLFEVYSKTREKGLGTEVKRRIMLGTYALSAGYYEAYYLKAQKIRNLIARDFIRAFEQVDLIVSPTAPTTAFKIGEKTQDPLSMYLCDIFTAPVNLAGLPAISLPVQKEKMPVGLQIIGRHFEEKNIFKLSKLIEKNG